MLVQLSRLVMSNSLQPHGLPYARPVCDQLLEIAQTHVHRVSDAIQPSHPLLLSPVTPFSFRFHTSRAPGPFQMSQFFDQMVKILGLQLQHQSFQ